MNATNAHSTGYSDAQRYFRLSPEDTRVGKDELLRNAQNRAFYSYGVKSLKTIALYVKGYAEGIDAHEAQQAKEREEAERRANVPHNPNTRFCTCAACSEAV